MRALVELPSLDCDGIVGSVLLYWHWARLTRDRRKIVISSSRHHICASGSGSDADPRLNIVPAEVLRTQEQWIFDTSHNYWSNLISNDKRHLIYAAAGIAAIGLIASVRALIAKRELSVSVPTRSLGNRSTSRGEGLLS